MKGNWHGYKLRQTCPVCGSKGYCAYEGPIDNPIAVLCARVEQGCATRKDGSKIEARNGMGWLHRLQENPHWRPATPKPAPVVVPLSNRWLSEVASMIDRSRAGELAGILGVSAESLDRLRVGWLSLDAPQPDGRLLAINAWAFPMRDHRRNVIGIRLRSSNGSKWAAPGSTNGLFFPIGAFYGRRLYVVEGATDTAAMLHLGFDVLGRPSNTAGKDFIVAYCRTSPIEEVCIIRNNDPVGSRARALTDQGSSLLAFDLVRLGKKVRECVPPTKDVREWLHAGATHDDIEKLARTSAITKLSGAGSAIGQPLAPTT